MLNTINTMDLPDRSGDDALAISVVLPVFFRQATAADVAALDRALGSVFQQQFPGPFEVIVVDDGSDVDLRELAHALRDGTRPEIVWLRAPRNEGLVQALNRGLAAARHPWIARIDADDWWHSTKIARQVALLREDPEITLVATGMTIVDEAGVELGVYIRPGDWAGILKFAVETGCPFPHGSVLGRRDVFLALGGYSFDFAVRHCEDWDLWSRWIRFFRVANVTDALYFYTRSSHQISAIHAGQQSAASGRVQAGLLANRDLLATPELMAHIASEMGLGLGEAGHACVRLWRHGGAMTVRRSALAALRRVLPDRDLRDLGAPRPGPMPAGGVPVQDDGPWASVLAL